MWFGEREGIIYNALTLRNFEIMTRTCCPKPYQHVGKVIVKGDLAIAIFD
jgi:hypothetical protein